MARILPIICDQVTTDYLAVWAALALLSMRNMAPCIALTLQRFRGKRGSGKHERPYADGENTMKYQWLNRRYALRNLRSPVSLAPLPAALRVEAPVDRGLSGGLVHVRAAVAAVMAAAGGRV